MGVNIGLQFDLNCGWPSHASQPSNPQGTHHNPGVRAFIRKDLVTFADMWYDDVGPHHFCKVTSQPPLITSFVESQR